MDQVTIIKDCEHFDHQWWAPYWDSNNKCLSEITNKSNSL